MITRYQQINDLTIIIIIINNIGFVYVAFRTQQQSSSRQISRHDVHHVGAARRTRRVHELQRLDADETAARLIPALRVRRTAQFFRRKSRSRFRSVDGSGVAA